MEWPNLAMMSERYQLSDKASAAVANTALEDAGLIIDLDKTYSLTKTSCEEKDKNTET